MITKERVLSTITLLEQYAKENSDDAETQVGAAVLDEQGRVLSTGYNHLPFCTEGLPNTRPEKYPYMIHAEVNALAYYNSHEGNVLLVTHKPCVECIKVIHAHKIKTVVYRHDYGTVTSDFARIFGIELIKESSL